MVSRSKNARQVALFVLALKKFKELDPLGKDGKDPKLSYYEIAGLRRARSIQTVYPANYPQEFTENLGSHGTVLSPSKRGNRSPNGRLLCPQHLDFSYLASAIPALIRGTGLALRAQAPELNSYAMI